MEEIKKCNTDREVICAWQSAAAIPGRRINSRLFILAVRVRPQKGDKESTKKKGTKRKSHIRPFAGKCDLINEPVIGISYP